MSIGSRVKKLRSEKRLTQKQLANKVNVSPQVISNWERGYTDPSPDDVKLLSESLECSADYILGNTDKRNPIEDSKLPELTEKEERDIQKDLEEMINNLNSTDGYAAFDGRSIDEVDEDDRELLIASLEYSLRLAKRMAKQKFTPKKYRK